MKIRLIVLLVLAMPFLLMSQEKPAKAKKESLRSVIRLLDLEDYDAAASRIEDLLIKYPDDPLLNLQAGICYVNIDSKEGDAIKYLKKAIAAYPLKKKKDIYAIEARYYLGQALHLNYEFDESLKVLQQLKSDIEKLGIDKEDLMKMIDREIEYNENAIKYRANPIDFRITNLGSAVNSEYNEHSPVLSADESVLIFTSDRPGTGNIKSPDGLYNEDIYVSEWREGKWLPALNIGEKINTMANDASVSLSPDGRTLVVYRNDGLSGDLYISVYEKDGWSELKKLPKPVNSTYNETHGTFTSDGNTIYFTSDRPGGEGGMDIYVSHKLPDGEWGKPQNLGPDVNTPYDEDSPFIHSDGKTLYFASEGHSSMGGFDVFYSVRNDSDQWSEAVNVGYPVNTPDDDLFYIPTADGQRVYYSSKRKGGFGMSDIYIIEFPETDPRSLAVIAGFVYISDNKPAADASIKISKYGSGEIVGVYRPNPQTGKYIIILPTEVDYVMEISKDNCISVERKVNIPSRSEFSSKKKVVFIDPVVLKKE